jgi:hypothetical protein
MNLVSLLVVILLLLCIAAGVTQAKNDDIYDSYHKKYGYCINETTLVRDFRGQASIVGSLAKCIFNIQDALVYPGYYTGLKENVSVQVTINNLIQIDELQSTASFDIFFWLSWTDTRLAMVSINAYSALLCSVPICSAVLCFALFCSLFFCSVFAPFFSILFSLIRLILLYSSLLYSSLLIFDLFLSILLYSKHYTSTQTL